MGDFKDQLEKMRTQPGFIAALDQSGGSTPSALRAYGIKDDAWSNEDQMFTIVHQMRTRIMTSPAFTGERILEQDGGENPLRRERGARHDPRTHLMHDREHRILVRPRIVLHD